MHTSIQGRWGRYRFGFNVEPGLLTSNANDGLIMPRVITKWCVIEPSGKLSAAQPEFTILHGILIHPSVPEGWYVWSGLILDWSGRVVKCEGDEGTVFWRLEDPDPLCLYFSPLGQESPFDPANPLGPSPADRYRQGSVQ